MPGECVDTGPAEYQRRVLPDVSRTFALTIPQLPPPVDDIVTNAYLLCRIADTVEDDAALSARQKTAAHQEFLAALRGDADAVAFGRRIGAALSEGSSRHDRELVRQAHKVIAYTHSRSAREQEVLLRCVTIMCRGMGEYQRNASPAGLADLEDLDRYCYYVAGVVGEMLTELFTLHSPRALPHREAMLALAPSFGEGLQLTNILKDVWDDRQRGACWLPRDVFAGFGVDLAEAQPGTAGPGFAGAMDYMVGVAHEHLRDAMRYTLMLPGSEFGMRRFCLWAIGMAVLTLWRIHRNPRYRHGDEVKIPRWMVKAVVIGSNVTARHERLLKALFGAVTIGLPRNKKPIDPDVSDWNKTTTVGYDDSMTPAPELRRVQTQ